MRPRVSLVAGMTPAVAVPPEPCAGSRATPCDAARIGTSAADDVLVDRLPCLAPFAALALRFDRFGVCCSSSAEAPLPEAPDSAAGREAIFNDPLYRDLRRRMIDGEQLPRDCRACLAHNTTSQLFRSPKVRAVAVSNLTRMDRSGRIGGFELAYAFANLDNQCNLACRTCSSTYSTTYARKLAAHARPLGHDRVDGRRRSPVAALSLLSQARVCVEFQGGEPFVSPLFTTALDRLRTGQVRIITNGTLAPAAILDRLARVADLTIWVSMDGARDTNTRIRHGLDHDRFLQTLRRVATALPWARRRINFTVSRYNIGTIPSFLSELQVLGQLVEGFDYHFVELPLQMRLTTIAPEARARVLAELASLTVPPGPFAATARRMIAHVSRELAGAPEQDSDAEATLVRFDAAVDALGRSNGAIPEAAPPGEAALVRG